METFRRTNADNNDEYRKIMDAKLAIELVYEGSFAQDFELDRLEGELRYCTRVDSARAARRLLLAGEEDHLRVAKTVLAKTEAFGGVVARELARDLMERT